MTMQNVKREYGLCDSPYNTHFALVISLGLGVFYLPQNLTVTTFSSQNVHTRSLPAVHITYGHEYRKVSEEGDALFKNQIDTKRLCIEFVTLGIVTGLLYLIFKE
jgi:hypothetical protein